MTDLKNGIIEIDGFEFRPGTTIDEVLSFFGNNVRILELTSGQRVKFLKPFYLTENLYAYAFNFNKQGLLTRFALIPVAPDTIVDCGYGEIPKYKLAASKKWLKAMINCVPHTSNDSCVFYKFVNVDYFASITKDIHYGLIGGEIDITYHEV